MRDEIAMRIDLGDGGAFLDGHSRDLEQPWAEGRGDSAAAKRALGWVNKHLKAIKSPLAVESVLDEYDRGTSATAANNNYAAVRAVIKKGDDGGKTKAKSSSSKRIVKRTRLARASTRNAQRPSQTTANGVRRR